MEKLIDGYEYHNVTIDGVITNTKTGKEKSIWLGKVGYYCVDINEYGKAKKHYVHRLLACAFLPNPLNKRTVNHKDGNKLNNDLSNLEWATDSENMQHAYDTGLKFPCLKVTEGAISEVFESFLQGKTLTAIAEGYDFSLPSISTHLNAYAEKVGRLDEFLKEKRKQCTIRNKNANHKKQRVSMINGTTLEVIKVFDSTKDAARYLGKSTSGPISNVLSGRCKTGYGYFWERV